MPKSEQGQNASNKPNKGQDENLHTFIAPDGSTVESTMRDFRNNLRDQGYQKQDDVEEAVTEPEVPANETGA